MRRVVGTGKNEIEKPEWVDYVCFWPKAHAQRPFQCLPLLTQSGHQVLSLIHNWGGNSVDDFWKLNATGFS